MSGILCEDFAQRVGLIGKYERADWDITTCLMTVRHREVNWHRSHDAADLAIDYYNTDLKVETASK